MNTYEPDNPLQQSYNALWPGCLCGHGEWCASCDGSLEVPRLALEQLARTSDYTLYCPWNTEQPIQRAVPRFHSPTTTQLIVKSSGKERFIRHSKRSAVEQVLTPLDDSLEDAVRTFFT